MPYAAGSKPIFVAVTIALALGAGCLSAGPQTLGASGTTTSASAAASAKELPWSVFNLVENATPVGGLVFKADVVTAIKGIASDLYEPSVHVAANGAIYAAAHVAGALTTGTPAAVSTDNGTTWHELPGPEGQNPVADNVQGGGRVGGDEGVITTDAKNNAWMMDDGAENQALYEWCDNGASMCNVNPIAWNAVQNGPAVDKCSQVLIADRPWDTYGDGKLLLQDNNGGPAMFGIYDVKTGALAWNDCVDKSNWTPSIAGPGSIRDSDGAFLVPQAMRVGPAPASSDPTGLRGGPNAPYAMYVLRGNVSKGPAVERVGPIFPVYTNGSPCSGSANFGTSGVSKAGTFYVGAIAGPASVGIATSSDLATFRSVNLSFPAGEHVSYVALAGNPNGNGAALTVGVWKDGTCKEQDFYVGHVLVGADGVPEVAHLTKVANVPGMFGDLLLNSVGPDGRAYFITVGMGTNTTASDGPLPATPLGANGADVGGTPLTVWQQAAGMFLGP
ncbi:MAG: hypothetical protein ACYDDF_04410 [Thermoplasmatota archaeon]